MGDSTKEITLVLSAMEKGEQAAPSELFALIYGELRSRAERLMSGERRDHTLQPTALVNEAFLKVAKPGVSFESKLHFYNAASLAMRRIPGRSRQRRQGRQAWRRVGRTELGRRW